MSFRLSSPYRGQPGIYRGSSRSSRLGQECLQTLFSAGHSPPTVRASWRTLLWWLMLSHIGTDVLDEWVFGCQGASGACGPLNSLLQLSTAQTELIFSKNLKQIFQRPLSASEQLDHLAGTFYTIPLCRNALRRTDRVPAVPPPKASISAEPLSAHLSGCGQ